MSLKRNIVANYIGQAYKALIGIVVMPLYLNYLGAEAYGLIGFFVMLQTLLQVLDMGLRPTLAREAARYKAATISANDLRSLLHSMEFIFVILAIIFLFSIYFNSIWIATEWLNVKLLTIEEVSNAIIIMGIVIAFRWTTSIYRGIISGFEYQAWLNSYDIIASTFRYLGVLIAFIFFSATIQVFFIYQLLISIFEAMIIVFYTYNVMPRVVKFAFSIKPLKNIYHFAFAIAFTSAIWIAVTQIDKLTLSKVLQLSEYGYFSLAIAVSSAIYILGNAIGTALMPRLTVLYEEKNYDKLEYLYLISREISVIILAPASAMLVFFGYEIVYLWTSDAVSSQYVSEIMKWYTMGNLVLSMSAFGYYLQYTKGDLKLHIKGQVGFAFFAIPIQYFVALQYGAIGTGQTWFILNSIYLLFWIGVIHKKFLIFSHLVWLKEIFISVSISFFVIYAFSVYINIRGEDKLFQLLTLIGIWFISMISTILSAIRIRLKVQDYFIKN